MPSTTFLYLTTTGKVGTNCKGHRGLAGRPILGGGRLNRKAGWGVLAGGLERKGAKAGASPSRRGAWNAVVLGCLRRRAGKLYMHNGNIVNEQYKHREV